jgi:hypothetical protein
MRSEASIDPRATSSLFPSALLGEERDALQAQAPWSKAARYDEARARDSFRKRTPGSLFLPMVDAAIASIPGAAAGSSSHRVPVGKGGRKRRQAPGSLL